MPRGRRTSLEQLKAPIEPGTDLLECENRCARGRELDRERDSVEPPADFRHIGRVSLGQGESRPRARRAIAEEPNRGDLRELRDVIRALSSWRLERRHLERKALGNPERFPTRGEDPDSLTGPEE